MDVRLMWNVLIARVTDCLGAGISRGSTHLGEITHCFITLLVGYLRKENNLWIPIDMKLENWFFLSVQEKIENRLNDISSVR